MKRRLLFMILPLLLLGACKEKHARGLNLESVLENLKGIESAAYHSIVECWQPYDTVPLFTRYDYTEEYRNPVDTIVGVCVAKFDGNDTSVFNFGYDGSIRVVVYHDQRFTGVDDFSKNTLPFRLVNSPFFTYAENIIEYALTTQDSIRTEFDEMDDHYFFRLTIFENRQVEFFGKAHYIPENPYILDPTSIYEIWIAKSTGLPYKIRREMSHDVTAETCLNPVFNSFSVEDFNVYDYFHPEYEIVPYKSGRKSENSTKEQMENKPAPHWTLEDIEGRYVSLGDFGSKVLLVNFTGIGCGPCQVAVPFLKELKRAYDPDEFDIVAIETWTRKQRSLKLYSESKELNYTMLSANDQVVEDYKTGGGAPVFFVLDENRVIRKVVNGYTPERVDAQITEAIEALLQ